MRIKKNRSVIKAIRLLAVKTKAGIERVGSYYVLVQSNRKIYIHIKKFLSDWNSFSNLALIPPKSRCSPSFISLKPLRNLRKMLFCRKVFRRFRIKQHTSIMALDLLRSRPSKRADERKKIARLKNLSGISGRTKLHQLIK